MTELLNQNPSENQTENQNEPVKQDENKPEDKANDIPQMTHTDHLKALKAKADMMGITYSNNIGLEALREKINAKLEPAPEDKQNEQNQDNNPNPLDPEAAVEAETTPKEKKLSLRQRLVADNMRLIRCRVTNMDPKKSNLPGEVLTVANEYIGTVRKFVPYGEQTDDSYHVPYCIFKMMKNRKFLQIKTVRDQRTGTNRVSTSMVREFALEELPPLTPQELKDLATAQAAAGSVQ